MILECGGSTPLWFFGFLVVWRHLAKAKKPNSQCGVEPPHSACA
jgi:hypothetical protein